MINLEYKTKVMPIMSDEPSFNMKKALKSFAIVSEGLTVKELWKSLNDRMMKEDIASDEYKCLQIILKNYNKICKKHILSSAIANECNVSRHDIKKYFLQILTKNKILHYKITDQIKNMKDKKVATLIKNINKYYKISFSDAYEKNEQMGKKIFLDILYYNFYTNDDFTKFPQIASYPYLNYEMTHDISIDITDYEKKIIKYYRDYTVPVTFDGININYQCPDTKGEFIDNETLCTNFKSVTDFYKTSILEICKQMSDKMLKSIMKEDFYKPDDNFTIDSKYDVNKENVDKYLIEIGYNSQSLVTIIMNEIKKKLNTDKFLTLDGITIEQTFLDQYNYEKNKMKNFLLIVKNNEKMIIKKYLMPYLKKIAMDLCHMYYLPKIGFALPKVLDTEFIRIKMHLFSILDKKQYDEQLHRYDRHNPSHSLEDLIKNMPMEHELNYFKPQNSNNGIYKNYNTNGKSSQYLPQIEITDVRANNIRMLRNNNKPNSARDYVAEKQIPISARSY